jgi:hypothetical protein
VIAIVVVVVAGGRLGEIDEPHEPMAGLELGEPCGDAVIVRSTGQPHLAKSVQIFLGQGIR